MSTRDGRIRTLALVLLISAAASGVMAQTTSARLTEMALQKEGQILTVLLKVEGTYAVEASFLPAPPRLVVDLTPMNQSQVLPYTQIDDIGVLDVRTGQFTPETTRIVFDLSVNVPAYKIVQTVEGLKITFWYEGEVPPLEAPVRVKEVTPVESAPAETPAETAVTGRSNYFLAARAGMTIFLSSDLTVRKEFLLYGETGRLDEAYVFKNAPAYEIQFGRYFGQTKLGLGVTHWSVNEPGTFTLDVPHPFVANSFRNVVFEAPEEKFPAWNFTAFALFSILQTEKLGLSAGPMIGLITGKTRSLSNFNFNEQSPFTAADVTISDVQCLSEDFRELLFGALLGLEYRPSAQWTVLMDLRLSYANPKNTALNQRNYLLHFQPILGLQYNF